MSWIRDLVSKYIEEDGSKPKEIERIVCLPKKGEWHVQPQVRDRHLGSLWGQSVGNNFAMDGNHGWWDWLDVELTGRYRIDKVGSDYEIFVEAIFPDNYSRPGLVCKQRKDHTLLPTIEFVSEREIGYEVTPIRIKGEIMECGCNDV